MVMLVEGYMKFGGYEMGSLRAAIVKQRFEWDKLMQVNWRI